MNRLYIPTITPIFAAVARIVIAISVALVFVSGHGVSSEPMRTIKIVVP
jgi:hypothetical protein